jgi:agmatinase
MLTRFAGPGHSFLGVPVEPDLDHLAAEFAVVGIPFGMPYDMRRAVPDAAKAPAAIRARSARFGPMLGHHDFDLGGRLFAGRPARIADCGDVLADPRDIAGSGARATEAVRRIVERRAVPIVLGGDDSITALAIAGAAPRGPLGVLQIDAHIDFRDEVEGVRDGYSSPMRRASEMAHVERIVHVGARGVGSARAEDLAATLAAGNAIVAARDLRRDGVEAALRHCGEGKRWWIALDCDGLDPAVMPGTGAPLPGGLDFYEAADLLAGLARRGEIVGISVAEHFPGLDVNGITALAIARLLIIVMHAVVTAR